MNTFLNLVIGGATTGCIYSLIASGIVLTYSTSGIFNFAHGVIAFTSAVVYWECNQGFKLPIVPSAIIAIGIWSPLFGIVLDRVLFRHLSRSSESARIIGTLGLVVAIPELVRIGLRFLAETMKLGPRQRGATTGIIPLGGQPSGLWEYPNRFMNIRKGITFNTDQFVVVIAAVAGALLLYLVVRHTRLGLNMQATVDRPQLAAMRGIDNNAASRSAWALGSMLAGLAGVVAAPLLPAFGFQDSNYTLLTLVSAAAAVIGRFRSIPLAFLGGLMLGALQNLVIGYAADIDAWISPGSFRLFDKLPGLQSSAPYWILLTGLWLLGRDRSRRAGVAASLADTPPASRPQRGRVAQFIMFIVVPALAIAWVSLMAGFYGRFIFVRGLSLGLIFLSFTIVTGIGGMVSLAQPAFAVGGAVAAGIMFDRGWPFIPAVLLGMVCAAAAGAIIALPALRLGGISLALATLVLAFIAYAVIFPQPFLSHRGVGWKIPRPALGPVSFESQAAIAGLLIVLIGLISWMIRNLERSSTGRALIAVRNAETAAATSGIYVTRAKLAVFALSASVAGLGGIMRSSGDKIFAADFPVTIGFVWLTVVVTLGVRRPIGAILAGLAFETADQLTNHRFLLGDIDSVFGLATNISLPNWGWSLFDAAALVGLIGLVLRLWRSWRTQTLVRELQSPAAVVSLAMQVGVIIALFHWDFRSAPELVRFGFGLGAVIVAREPDGLLGRLTGRSRLERSLSAAPLRWRRASADVTAADVTAADVTAADVTAADVTAADVTATDVTAADVTAAERPALTGLVLRGVSAGYGDVGVLHGVNLEVPHGQITALLGANGCGKTTLSQVVIGAVVPTAGQVSWMGRSLRGVAVHARARQGIVIAPEQRGIFAGLTVDENLEVWLRSARERNEAYERFPLLAERRRLAAGNLSGGEQQMLTLAPLLVRPPELLVADEPTLGLAPLVVEQIRATLVELRRRGVTILLIEEKAQHVLDIADRIALMELGRVTWQGPREELDQTRLTAAYLGANQHSADSGNDTTSRLDLRGGMDGAFSTQAEDTSIWAPQAD